MCSATCRCLPLRLLHHTTTLNIKRESYRLQEKHNAGLLGRRKPEN